MPRRGRRPYKPKVRKPPRGRPPRGRPRPLPAPKEERKPRLGGRLLVPDISPPPVPATYGETAETYAQLEEQYRAQYLRGYPKPPALGVAIPTLPAPIEAQQITTRLPIAGPARFRTRPAEPTGALPSYPPAGAGPSRLELGAPLTPVGGPRRIDLGRFPRAPFASYQPSQYLASVGRYISPEAPAVGTAAYNTFQRFQGAAYTTQAFLESVGRGIEDLYKPSDKPFRLEHKGRWDPILQEFFGTPGPQDLSKLPGTINSDIAEIMPWRYWGYDSYQQMLDDFAYRETYPGSGKWYREEEIEAGYGDGYYGAGSTRAPIGRYGTSGTAARGRTSYGLVNWRI